MLRFLYRLAWALARPLAAPLALAGRGGKLGRTLRGRRTAVQALRGWARERRADRPLVWFHAASVGEGRQALAVLARLREARPGWQTAYTFGSASAERFAASLPADVAGFAPFDAPADVRGALEALRPSALVFSATDVWPELVRQARAGGVALGLISAALPPTSSRRGGLARRLLAPAYASLDAVGAVDRADARGLEELGVPAGRITVTGDTRHDAAVERLARVDRAAPHLRALARLPPAPIVVAGSTWRADEAVLLPALAAARASGVMFHLVIAPHEPTRGHLEALEANLRRHLGAATRVVRLSSLLSPANSEPLATDNLASGNLTVVVVDVVGILAELYVAASIAYVGGGFHGAGLHSVIEPAAAGVPVLFGPRWTGSRDARLLLEAGGGRAAGDRAALGHALTEWLRNDRARAAAGAAARAVVEHGVGAADRSLQLVIDLVERRSPQPTP